MSATNAFETSLLALIFNATAIANIADNAGTSPATNLYISLHTADPGETGNQTTSESAYTSYARVAVTRDSGGWTVSGNTANNTAVINFPACTGGTSTITHFGIGLASSGTGTLLFSGALSASLSVSNGITPSFAIGQLSVTAD
jgi:hypothetical protein